MNISFTSAEISADSSYPMEIYFCLLYSGNNDDNPYSVMPKHPFCSGWGIGSGKQICISERKPFTTLEIAWLSLSECKFYYGQFDLNEVIADINCDEIEERIDNLIIGLAPGAKIAFWANGEYCSKLVGIAEAKEINLSISDFLEYDYPGSVSQYCKQVIEDSGCKYGCPANLEFDKRMRHYWYRFSIKVKSVMNIDTTALQIFYTDGSYNNLDDDKAFCFREAAIPLKLNIKHTLQNCSNTISLFFETSTLYKIFERFYGAHPETKTDFIIRIDAGNKKYELALYRQGLKEPVVIPESAYQMIVFKNKFEDYRSDNYNQPRGAWIW